MENLKPTMQNNSDDKQPSWRDAIAVFLRRKVITMTFLGFSAGLPYLLVFSTLSAWLSEAGVQRTAIGFFSWVGITFSIKVLWAPVLDNLAIPWVTRFLGQRRSWMLTAQLGLLVGLFSMSTLDPGIQIWSLALLATFVAFCSATQDICIDAYRIEAAPRELQAAMAATYIFGYRLALLVSGAGAFYVADLYDWELAYQLMALLMLIGIATTGLISEPSSVKSVRWGPLEISLLERLNTKRNVITSKLNRAMVLVYAPFFSFFQEYRGHAAILLLFIGVFRISDITMGVMANPFYLELGFTKSQIASIAKVFGFLMTILGSALGGVLVVKMGIMSPLLITAILVMITNLLFSILALMGPDLNWLALVIGADNLAGGMSNVVFIAFLSSLVNQNYTATQYALFSSIMTLPGKFAGGFSGLIIDSVGYPIFFVYAAFIGLPAILLTMYFMRKKLLSIA